MTGGFQESAKTGSANLSIPVEGSVGKGRLRVSAEKREGNWIITEMKLSTKDREIRIAPIEDSCY
jgi:hypothetical protein